MKNTLCIKEVYKRRFKDTLPQGNMKEDTTFAGLLSCIENRQSVDKYLFTECPNNLIRNRVIALLCEEYDLEYDYLKNFLKTCKKN